MAKKKKFNTKIKTRVKQISVLCMLISTGLIPSMSTASPQHVSNSSMTQQNFARWYTQYPLLKQAADILIPKGQTYLPRISLTQYQAITGLKANHLPVNAVMQLSVKQRSILGVSTNPFGVRDDVLNTALYTLKDMKKDNLNETIAAIKLAYYNQRILFLKTDTEAKPVFEKGMAAIDCIINAPNKSKWMLESNKFMNMISSITYNTKERKHETNRVQYLLNGHILGSDFGPKLRYYQNHASRAERRRVIALDRIKGVSYTACRYFLSEPLNVKKNTKISNLADTYIPRFYVLFLNGIQNSKTYAEKSLQKLQEKSGIATFGGSNIMGTHQSKFELIYNDDSKGMWSQIEDTMMQKASEGVKMWNWSLADYTKNYLEYMNKNNNANPLLPLTRSQIKKSYEKIQSFMGTNMHDIEGQFNYLTQHYQTVLLAHMNAKAKKEGKALYTMADVATKHPYVLVIAHSQGNLYANNLYTYATQTAHYPPNHFGILGIGSPAGEILGGINPDIDLLKNTLEPAKDHYVTGTNDHVMNFSGAFKRLDTPWEPILKGNVYLFSNDLLCTGDIKCHDLQKVYLADPVVGPLIGQKINLFIAGLLENMYSDGLKPNGAIRFIEYDDLDTNTTAKMLCNGLACTNRKGYVTLPYDPDDYKIHLDSQGYPKYFNEWLFASDIFFRDDTPDGIYRVVATDVNSPNFNGPTVSLFAMTGSLNPISKRSVCQPEVDDKTMFINCYQEDGPFVITESKKVGDIDVYNYSFANPVIVDNINYPAEDYDPMHIGMLKLQNPQGFYNDAYVYGQWG